MAEWKLRLARPEDATGLLAADVFDGPADPGAVARFLGRPGAPDPRNILILAEVDGRVVGFASGTVLDHPDKPRMLFINELGVNEDMQRQGIARVLLAAIRTEGRARGCRKSWLATETDNLPALALYRATKGTETAGLVMFDWDERPAGG